MIDSDQHPDSNLHPLLKSTSLTSLFQITVRFKAILKSVSLPNSQIYGQFLYVRVRVGHMPVTSLDVGFEKVRSCHRFENLKKRHFRYR